MMSGLLDYRWTWCAGDNVVQGKKEEKERHGLGRSGEERDSEGMGLGLESCR